jgi:transcription-repair coupling factor (superfamily II helicase)
LAAAVKQARTLGRFEGLKLDLKTASLDALHPMGLPVNVDLPLAIGIPEVYVPDTNLRLRLYRRLADLTDEAALDALSAEFTDRFGVLPEMATNLFYQMRVKLHAERASLISVGMESGQIVLRYPPPPEGLESKRLPDLGPGVRGGKNAYWCMFGKDADWQEKLLEVLKRLEQYKTHPKGE